MNTILELLGSAILLASIVVGVVEMFRTFRDPDRRKNASFYTDKASALLIITFVVAWVVRSVVKGGVVGFGDGMASLLVACFATGWALAITSSRIGQRRAMAGAFAAGLIFGGISDW